ncbi:MAG: exodeoxyribonuclease VII small subunit [Bryobacteraceae bacterium]|nr:exodeoxyribonuclease VII small subunit [Bryobacteraceae bacterium]
MARKQHSDSDAPTFEQNLDRLEALVKRLEESELPLEEALKLFEEGTALSAGCRKQLEEAEHRVEVLTKTADGIVAEPMQDLSAEE